jgi:hypothetical protein
MAQTSTLGSAPRGSALSAAVAEIGAFLAILGAAIRVSAAVEAGREPEKGDVSLLGIKGSLPRIR